MQFKNIGFGVRGLYALPSLALREANMSATAEQRRDAPAFCDKHGLRAALGHAGVCRSTLHAWRAAYRERGAAGLCDKSRAPHTARTIGRLIKDAPDKMRHAPTRLTLKGKARPPQNPRPSTAGAT